MDEAIYAIAPEASGDIHDFFYATVYDRVSTEASLSYYFNGEAGKKQMFLAWQSKSRTALAQLKPGDAMVEPKVRKDFPDTALWLADVHYRCEWPGSCGIEFSGFAHYLAGYRSRSYRGYESGRAPPIA